MLASRLKELKDWQQLLLGSGLVARMQPNFVLFCQLTDFTDPRIFGNILSLVWEHISGVNQNIDFDKQIDKLELITPVPENYDMYGVWPAHDATVSLASLLSAALRFDSSEIAAIVMLSRSTIINYLTTINEVQATDDHPLLQLEENWIDDALVFLKMQDDKATRQDVVRNFRRWVADEQQSNIGLSVE